MNSIDRGNPNALRDHLANTRTLLAWIRTALTITGLGFVVAKFGLLVPRLRLHGEAHLVSTGIGTGLVFLGAVFLTVATLDYSSVRNHIDRQDARSGRVAPLALVAVLLLLSVILALYLFLTG